MKIIIMVATISLFFMSLNFTNQNIPSSTENEIAEQDITDSWLTYLNEEIGFSFKYPQNAFTPCGEIPYVILQKDSTFYLVAEKYRPQSANCEGLIKTTVEDIVDKKTNVNADFRISAKKVNSLEAAKTFIQKVCKLQFPLEEDTNTYNRHGADSLMLYFAHQSINLDELMSSGCFGSVNLYSKEKGIAYLFINPKTGGGWIAEDKDGNILDFLFVKTLKIF